MSVHFLKNIIHSNSILHDNWNTHICMYMYTSVDEYINEYRELNEMWPYVTDSFISITVKNNEFVWGGDRWKIYRLNGQYGYLCERNNIEFF